MRAVILGLVCYVVVELLLAVAFIQTLSCNLSHPPPAPGLLSLLGYYPSNAFDNNPETIWVSNGQAPPGMQWIAFEFDHPVSVGSIRIASEIDKPERAPTEIYVEGSCEKYFRTFETMWVLRNPMQKSDIRVHGEVKRRDAGKPRFRRYR